MRVSGRVTRAALTALLLSLPGMVVGASVLSDPVISGVSPWIVSAGQQITISGDHFANDTTGDCSATGPPTVLFLTPSGFPVSQLASAQPAPADCSNGNIKVTVPGGLPGAARIAVTDSQGHSSNTGSSGFFPLITIQPRAGISPVSGQVGTPVTVSGSNLHPPSVVPGAALRLTAPGVDTQLATWGDSMTFGPGNSSGPVSLSFPVSTDANNPGSGAQSVSVAAGTYTFLPPVMNDAGINHQVVGSQLSLAGDNLGGTRGSVTFPAAGGRVSATPAAWSRRQVVVLVPAGAQDGKLIVNVPGYGSVDGPTVKLDPVLAGLSPATGWGGTPVTLTGYNLGPRPGSVTVGGVIQTVTSWSDQLVVFTLSGDSDAGDSSLTRADGAAARGPALTIVPHLTQLQSNHIPAGGQLVVDGISLGSAPGTATIGGKDAAVLLWSRGSVFLQLPAALSSGTYTLALTTAGGLRSNPLNVDIAATPATPSPVSRHASSPSVDNNHQFVKPIKPPSPVSLSLDASPHQTAAGGTADLTVTLQLSGKALSGAPIKLSMLSSPGTDYQFTPDSGVTDAAGVFKARVRISSRSGDNIILAESGVFSDQDHVLGRGGPSGSSARNPAAAGGALIPLLGLAALAVALVTGGAFLNLRSLGIWRG